MKIAVIPNLHNDGVRALTDDILSQLDALGADAAEATAPDGSEDLIIAVGGDGTTLNIAKQAALYGLETLGINAGRLGFMSGLERNELSLLSELVNGCYTVDERMMLCARICEAGKPDREYHALNDAVITRGDWARLIDISVLCDGRAVTDTRADGLIVSTPTGSTAYTMAAGGPVVSPDNACFIVTPICPHSLMNRSIIFPADKELEVCVGSDKNNGSYISIDGNESIPISVNSKIVISKSRYTAKLIKLKPDNFYEILNKKILERRY
ncbi:MAG: NAD(+)/NADH kinase [Eubacterium sp.]|nr:NAD(+)/NADH kinase [Eubacterium sp.]